MCGTPVRPLGVETLATMVPVEKKGVVVLVNGGSGLGFGETTQLRNGITARALGLDYDGEGSRWSQKALFIGLVLLPFIYLLSMIWAWRHRAEIRAKLIGHRRPVQPVVPAAHHACRGMGHSLAGAEPVRHTARQFAPVPARLRSGVGRNRSDRCALGRVQARGGLYR